MNTVNPTHQRAQLIKRRAEIALTLRHVELQKSDVEAKEASMDRDARASRLTLLRDLSQWYLREIKEVDQALRRFGQENYWLCSTCGAPLSSDRQGSHSGSKLCASCQDHQREL
jgi:RNA polymerase-binding transcription factor DksA